MLQHQNTPVEESAEQVTSGTVSAYAAQVLSPAPLMEQTSDTTTLPVEANHANAETQDVQWHQIEAAALEDIERTTINVPRLRRKLAKRSLLCRANIDWDSPARLTEEKFVALLSIMRDPNPAVWRERVLCAWLLGHSPLTADQKREAAIELGNVLQNRHAGRRERYNANLRDVSRVAIPLAAFLTILADAQLVNSSWHPNPSAYPLLPSFAFLLTGFLVSFLSIGVFWYFLLYPLLFPLVTARNMARSNRVRRAAALALGRLRAPEGIEALARATLDVSPHVRAIAEPALHLSLPTLTNEYYGRLGPFAVPALCHLLDHKKERLFAYHVRTERLVLQSLQALEKIGTGEAVSSVEKVARDGWTVSVRETAQQILPVLQERKRQENDPYILLRAAALPQSGDHLLRAASSALHDHTPEQLLRPQMSE
jgi:hypothetical protein